MKPYSFEVSSEIPVPRETVWQHATNLASVNLELFPLLRMTFPTGSDRLPESPPLGQRLFRSWVLLLGFLPVDYDDITFVQFDAPRRFLEESSMLTQRVWRHERIFRDGPRGCIVTDRLEFRPRIAILGPVYLPIFRAAFRLRQHNLRKLFAAGAAA